MSQEILKHRPALSPGHGGDSGKTAGGIFGRLFGEWLAQGRRQNEIARAIRHLQKASDAELKDLGIARADIERVVRFGKD